MKLKQCAFTSSVTEPDCDVPSLGLSDKRSAATYTKGAHPLVCSKNMKNYFATHQNKGRWGQMKAFSTKW